MILVILLIIGLIFYYGFYKKPPDKLQKSPSKISRKAIGLIILVIGIAGAIISQNITYRDGYMLTDADIRENNLDKQALLIAGIIVSVIGALIFISGLNKNQVSVPINHIDEQTISEKNNNIFMQIEKLNDLKEKGILTQDEFDNKKQELLSKM